jgi:hypothetical protein
LPAPTDSITGLPVERLADWRGADVLDPDGDKLGKVDAVWYDGETDDPAFVSVKAGLVGKHFTLVPLRGASVGRAFVRVAYGKNELKDAPRLDPDAELSNELEQQTYGFYGIEYTPAGSGARRLARR